MHRSFSFYLAGARTIKRPSGEREHSYGKGDFPKPMHRLADWVRQCNMFWSGSSGCLRGVPRLTLAFAVALVLLGSSESFAVSPYAPNITASHSTSVPVSGGGIAVNDVSTTGVSVSVTGLTGITGSIEVTTQTLNAPSTGVLTVSSTSDVFYFDVKIALPEGTSAASSSTA